jgi:hypothetical protein
VTNVMGGGRRPSKKEDSMEKQHKETGAPATAKASPTNTTGTKQTTATAKSKPKPKASVEARRGTKKAKLLTLLKRPGGASLEQLLKATGWQAHSVRGYLSGVLKRGMGLHVHSSKQEGRSRIYRLIDK